jgi:putative colanic acid biosynthesis acetyltransferase WcaF
MSNRILDVTANRRATKYTRTEQIMRVLWGCALPLFRFSPRICFGWRAFLLRRFGAKVGRDTHIYNSATIYMPWNFEIGDQSSVGEHAYIYNLGRITIGSRTTISQRAHLCAGTHDFTDLALPLLKPPIVVCDQAWICADAFVGPGVTVGEGAIVGARGVAVRDVAPWDIVAGNPARVVKKRDMRNGHGD